MQSILSFIYLPLLSTSKEADTTLLLVTKQVRDTNTQREKIIEGYMQNIEQMLPTDPPSPEITLREIIQKISNIQENLKNTQKLFLSVTDAVSLKSDSIYQKIRENRQLLLSIQEYIKRNHEERQSLNNQIKDLRVLSEQTLLLSLNIDLQSYRGKQNIGDKTTADNIKKISDALLSHANYFASFRHSLHAYSTSIEELIMENIDEGHPLLSFLDSLLENNKAFKNSLTILFSHDDELENLRTYLQEYANNEVKNLQEYERKKHHYQHMKTTINQQFSSFLNLYDFLNIRCSDLISQNKNMNRALTSLGKRISSLLKNSQNDMLLLGEREKNTYDEL